MMGKSIPLNNGQRKERIFIVTDCSWYVDEVDGMHMSCQQPDCTLFCRRGSVENLLFSHQDITTLGSQACCSQWHMWNPAHGPTLNHFSLINVGLSEGAPYYGCLFNLRADQDLVCSCVD